MSLNAKQTTAQALPGKSFETLKNMNAASQKYATWIVRVVQGRLVNYTFWSRGEKVEATKFQCILVSANSSEYMMGLVPFSFHDKKAPEKAGRKFLVDTCWEVTTPVFEASQKVEFNSCPIKTCLKLAPPSGLRAVTPLETDKYNYAAKSIYPSCNLEQALDILNTQARFAATSTKAGSPGSASAVASKVIDLSFKIRSKGASKSVSKNGNNRTILDLSVVDDSNMPDGKQAQVVVGVWDKAIANVPPEGAGCCVVGCTVTKEADGCKINVWDSAFWILTGDRAQTLTDLKAETDAQAITTLTAEFKPTAKPVDTSGQALPTCAVKLACVEGDVLVEGEDLTFQVNRGYFEASVTSLEEMHTASGKLQVRAVLWDWTGQCDVLVLENAVPALFGLAASKDVEARLCQPDCGGLAVAALRVNARGVVRLSQGTVKKLINEITVSPLQAKISGDAMRCIRGLSDSMESVVVVAPADRICDCPVLGMSAASDAGLKMPARRLVMVVTGTEESELNLLPAKPGSASQAFFVESVNVKCELSSSEHHAMTLRGYCGLKESLRWRLDSESAVVIVSAVDGPRSPNSGPLVLTVESMQKVGAANLSEVVAAMTIEWQVARGAPGHTVSPLNFSPSKEYWSSSNPMCSVKRMLSEPGTPQAAKRGQTTSEPL